MVCGEAHSVAFCVITDICGRIRHSYMVRRFLTYMVQIIIAISATTVFSFMVVLFQILCFSPDIIICTLYYLMKEYK
jgi:hypothetical protein